MKRSRLKKHFDKTLDIIYKESEAMVEREKQRQKKW